jgi:hypothetical protein
VTNHSGSMTLGWDGRSLQLGLAIPRERLLEIGFWIAALLLAGGQAWASRYYPSTVDLVSYLDTADAYFRGDWHGAVNGYWNPLYSWVLGAAFLVLRPSPESQYPVAKLVDFAIFVGCLASFGWFLHNLQITYRAARARDERSVVGIPGWAWVVTGYTIFLWASLRWITVTSNTPDMLAAALSYLAWGLLLRLERRQRIGDYLLVGFVLAFSYFARTPMFAVGGALLALGWLGARRARERARGYLLAALVFALLTAPFIAAISHARGHLTIGDNARLNHAWLASPGSYIIPNRHWQGGPAGYGVPLHPSRMLWDAPPTFEFAGPLGGVYPPWTDPSYWYEGLQYHFDPRAEWISFEHNLQFYFWLFGRWMLLALVASLGIMHFGATREALAKTARYWIPAALGLALYLVANDLLEQWRRTPQPPTRYVAIYVVIVCLFLVASLRFRRAAMTPMRQQLATAALGAVVVCVGGSLVREDLGTLAQPEPMPPYQLAQTLRAAGVTPGMRVAIIGPSSDHELWARLADVRIVADVPNEISFWSKPAEMQSTVIRVLARTGAQVVVAPWVPRGAADRGWQQAAETDYSVHWLSNDDAQRVALRR